MATEKHTSAICFIKPSYLEFLQSRPDGVVIAHGKGVARPGHIPLYLAPPSRKLEEDEEFHRLLRLYVKAAAEQHEWDRMAPVGMTKKQAEKEQKLHSATEKAYEAFMDYLNPKDATNEPA